MKWTAPQTEVGGGFVVGRGARNNLEEEAEAKRREQVNGPEGMRE